MFEKQKIGRGLLLPLIIIAVIFSQLSAAAGVWVNDLKNLFTNNAAVIYEINLRTFGAQDTNKNGIIDFDEGEEGGNFLNAIARLDELAMQGVNTVHVMPVTPVGKTKALGTAGSLYAAAGFNSLNPQLKSEKSALSVDAQARKFFNEAHNRGIRVIVDLPSCGSYDLYMQRPELFVKDKSGQPVIPSDWTDVRLLNAGTESNVNLDVYNLYKGFVDYMIDLGADGIRADVATLKPAAFWKELIAYSRRQDPQFLWLAEASEDWTEPVSSQAGFTPYNKLLEAGFDGYYGSFFNLKNWKTGAEFTKHLTSTLNTLKKFPEQKAVIGSFTTHDELSPLLINGGRFSEMIIWLNATLPVNSYVVDGFSTGDNYIYAWANKKARKTFTDDEYYFAHRGKIDIFNFSRQPGGANINLQREYVLANRLKSNIVPMLKNGNFTILKAANPSVFAYSVTYDKTSVVVYGNLNYKTPLETSVSIPKFSNDSMVVPVKINAVPVAGRGKLDVKLFPGEIQVLLVSDAK
jgi:glycosidase